MSRAAGSPTPIFHTDWNGRRQGGRDGRHPFPLSLCPGPWPETMGVDVKDVLREILAELRILNARLERNELRDIDGVPLGATDAWGGAFTTPSQPESMEPQADVITFQPERSSSMTLPRRPDEDESYGDYDDAS